MQPCWYDRSNCCFLFQRNHKWRHHLLLVHFASPTPKNHRPLNRHATRNPETPPISCCPIGGILNCCSMVVSKHFVLWSNGHCATPKTKCFVRPLNFYDARCCWGLYCCCCPTCLFCFRCCCWFVCVCTIVWLSSNVLFESRFDSTLIFCCLALLFPGWSLVLFLAPKENRQNDCPSRFQSLDC